MSWSPRTSCAFPGTQTVRFGVDGSYEYLNSTTSPVSCDNTTLGGDPIYGTVKHCDYFDCPVWWLTPAAETP